MIKKIMIERKYALHLFLILSSLFLSACSEKSPQPTETESVVKDKNATVIHVYESEKELKQAVIILTKKVSLLENRNNSGTNTNSTEVIALKSELKKIKQNEKNKSKLMSEKIKRLEEDLAKLSVSKKPMAQNSLVSALDDGSASNCRIVTYAMRSAGFYKAKNIINIRACPVPNSLIIGVIKKGEGVEFEGCDQYGWCKLKSRNGYVAGRLFIKISTSSNDAKSNISNPDNEQDVDAILKAYIKQ